MSGLTYWILSLKKMHGPFALLWYSFFTLAWAKGLGIVFLNWKNHLQDNLYKDDFCKTQDIKNGTNHKTTYNKQGMDKQKLCKDFTCQMPTSYLYHDHSADLLNTGGQRPFLLGDWWAKLAKFFTSAARCWESCALH